MGSEPYPASSQRPSPHGMGSVFVVGFAVLYTGFLCSYRTWPAGAAPPITSQTRTPQPISLYALPLGCKCEASEASEVIQDLQFEIVEDEDVADSVRDDDSQHTSQADA